MRREVALARLEKVVARLVEVQGVIETPDCAYRALHIRKAYLFGSLLKGSESPNDIDILLHSAVVGPYRNADEVGHDPAYLRRHGLRLSRDTHAVALKGLRLNIPMLRFHDIDIDGVIATPRREIFPRFCL